MDSQEQQRITDNPMVQKFFEVEYYRLRLAFFNWTIVFLFSLIGFVQAATVIDAQGADQLLERGNLGLAALVILGLITPIGVTVGAAVILIRRIVTIHDRQLIAQQTERERMAEKSFAERETILSRQTEALDRLCQTLAGMKEIVAECPGRGKQP